MINASNYKYCNMKGEEMWDMITDMGLDNGCGVIACLV